MAQSANFTPGYGPNHKAKNKLGFSGVKYLAQCEFVHLNTIGLGKWKISVAENHVNDLAIKKIAKADWREIENLRLGE